MKNDLYVINDYYLYKIYICAKLLENLFDEK